MPLKNKKIMLCLLVILVLTTACGPAQKDTFADEYEDVNQSITFSEKSLLRTQNNEIHILVRNQSQQNIVFPPDFGLQIFGFDLSDSKWKPIRNELYILTTSEIFLMPEGELGRDGITVSFIPDQSMPVDAIRVLVVGNIYVDGQEPTKQVAAWTEIQLDEQRISSQSTSESNPEQSILAAPNFSAAANEAFLANPIVQSESLNNINQAISMEWASTGMVSADAPSSRQNNMCFYVFNHTEEAIFFASRKLEAQLFVYDAITNLWTKFDPVEKAQQEFILPARLEEMQLEAQNWFCLLEQDFFKITGSEVRIYISGRGVASNNRYGAYMDVTIVPSSNP